MSSFVSYRLFEEVILISTQSIFSLINQLLHQGNVITFDKKLEYFIALRSSLPEDQAGVIHAISPN